MAKAIAAAGSEVGTMFEGFSNLGSSMKSLNKGEKFSTDYGENPLTEEEKLARQGESEDTGASKLEKAQAITAELSAIWTAYYDGLDERKTKSDTADTEGDKKTVVSKKQTFEGLLALGAAHNKKLAKVQKAYAIGNIIMDTAQGIAKAMRKGWVGLPEAAMVAANGAVQLATVKGQFHSGIDRVPSSGTYLLEQGERVVDKRLNEDLKQYLTNQNSTTNNSANVSMNFGNNTDPDAVYNNHSAIEQTIRDVFAEHALVAPF